MGRKCAFESSYIRRTLFFAGAILLHAQVVGASPWVLDSRRFVLGISAGTSFARSEFLPKEQDGKRQRFPLRGRFESYFLQIDSRYGFGYGFEGFLALQFKGVSYVSDPFAPLAFDQQFTGTDARNSVINFSKRAAGLGDIRMGIAHQHIKAPVRLASSLQLKVPTGYTSPRETFLRDESNQPVPGQVADDVTLGDGQTDIEYMLQLGYVVPVTYTLLELDAGYRARFAGPGHQFLATAKIGQMLSRYFLFIFETNTAITLWNGRQLGTTIVALDPSVPAEEFTGDNTAELPFRLDRSYVEVAGGALLRLGKRELIFRVAHTVWGINYSQLTTISIGVMLPFGFGDGKKKG